MTTPPPPVRHPSRREVWLERVARAAALGSHKETADAGEQGKKDKPLWPLPSSTPQPARTASQPRRSIPLPLGERDEALVRTVAQLHFLTAEQVCRLYYHAGSLSFVRARLKRLADAGFLLRLRLPRASAGNPPWVYTLARRGFTAMTHADLAVTTRFRPAEQQEKSYLFLAHTLAVNDFLIAALLLPCHVPQVILAGWRHERALRHTPIRVPTAPGELQTVIPDAWLDVHLAGQMRMSLLLELDRGTVEEAAFKRKVRGLLALALGPYAGTFHTTSLTVVFATTAGASRASQIVRWCEQVLRERHQEALADLMLIGNLPPAPLDPREVFLTPIWAQPLARAPVPLLNLVAASQRI